MNTKKLIVIMFIVLFPLTTNAFECNSVDSWQKFSESIEQCTDITLTGPITFDEGRTFTVDLNKITFAPFTTANRFTIQSGHLILKNIIIDATEDRSFSFRVMHGKLSILNGTLNITDRIDTIVEENGFFNCMNCTMNGNFAVSGGLMIVNSNLNNQTDDETLFLSSKKNISLINNTFNTNSNKPIIKNIHIACQAGMPCIKNTISIINNDFRFNASNIENEIPAILQESCNSKVILPGNRYIAQGAVGDTRSLIENLISDRQNSMIHRVDPREIIIENDNYKIVFIAGNQNSNIGETFWLDTNSNYTVECPNRVSRDGPGPLGMLGTQRNINFELYAVKSTGLFPVGYYGKTGNKRSGDLYQPYIMVPLDTKFKWINESGQEVEESVAGNDFTMMVHCEGNSSSNFGDIFTLPVPPPPQEEPECTNDSDCGTERICYNNSCIPIQYECHADSDCSNSESCVDGRCIYKLPSCDINEDCPAGQLCYNKKCMVPQSCTTITDCYNENWPEEYRPYLDGNVQLSTVCNSGICISKCGDDFCSPYEYCEGGNICKRCYHPSEAYRPPTVGANGSCPEHSFHKTECNDNVCICDHNEGYYSLSAGQCSFICKEDQVYIPNNDSSILGCFDTCETHEDCNEVEGIYEKMCLDNLCVNNNVECMFDWECGTYFDTNWECVDYTCKKIEQECTKNSDCYDLGDYFCKDGMCTMCMSDGVHIQDPLENGSCHENYETSSECNNACLCMKAFNYTDGCHDPLDPNISTGSAGGCSLIIPK